MSNIIEDAQAALTKLENIQKSFEDENKYLKNILDENKKVSEEIQQYNNDIMVKISECVNKMEKAMSSFRELNNKQDEIIDNVMMSLETKTRNNLKVAQENLNQLNLEISNYINDLQKVTTKEIKQLLETNFSDFEKLLETKKQEIANLNFSLEEKINPMLTLQEQKINNLVKEQNSKLKKYLYIIILISLIFGVVSIIGLFL